MSEEKARPKIPTKSWLIRCWEEPREQQTQGSPDPIHRCSVRDLETGEERYVSDPREVGDLVTRRMREAEKDTGGPEQPHMAD